MFRLLKPDSKAQPRTLPGTRESILAFLAEHQSECDRTLTEAPPKAAA